jgi:hypothetical protein
VQFVPICGAAACSLNAKFRQSIDALIQCVLLCLKIGLNFLSMGSAWEGVQMLHRPGAFLSQRTKQVCYRVQVVPKVAHR